MTMPTMYHYWLPDISYPNIFVPRRFVPPGVSNLALTLTLTLALTRNSNTNINSNPNPNSRYPTLTLFKNAGYETPV